MENFQQLKKLTQPTASTHPTHPTQPENAKMSTRSTQPTPQKNANHPTKLTALAQLTHPAPPQNTKPSAQLTKLTASVQSKNANQQTRLNQKTSLKSRIVFGILSIKEVTLDDAQRFGQAFVAKIDQIKKEEDKKRSIAGRLLLSRLYESLFQEKMPAVLYNEKGKPFLEKKSIEQIKMPHISLSHDGDYAACAIALKPVGIDICKIRNNEENEESARKAKSEERISRKFLGKKLSREAFAIFWTVTESSVKKEEKNLQTVLKDKTVHRKIEEIIEEAKNNAYKAKNPEETNKGTMKQKDEIVENLSTAVENFVDNSHSTGLLQYSCPHLCITSSDKSVFFPLSADNTAHADPCDTCNPFNAFYFFDNFEAPDVLSAFPTLDTPAILEEKHLKVYFLEDGKTNYAIAIAL